MKLWMILAIIFLLQSQGVEEACAATQTLLASIKFDTGTSFANTQDVSLGIVKAAQSGVYTISPSGTVTATNSGIWLGGDAHAGGMTIIGSTTQTIDIAVNNYVPQNGVTPSTAICNYNGGGATPCALHNQPAPGAGKPLLIGVTLVVDGTQQKSSVATPTFDVVVSYD